MKKAVFNVCVLLVLISASGAVRASDDDAAKAMNKVSLGNTLALYPSLAVVIGTAAEGKVNWMLATHTGIIGHDRIMVSMNSKHYTTRAILVDKKLSLNLIGRDMLRRADYVGSVSGADADKSEVFEYHTGRDGSPIIDASPLSMELDVVDVYKTEGFDNFICSVAHTYASPDMTKDGKPDYEKLKPVLFEFPTYSYMATGEIIGECLHLDDAPGMTAKSPMQPDGIIRLSEIEVDPAFLDEYAELAKEVGEISLRAEPGVLTMYALARKDKPNLITILETYSSHAAYQAHIASPHFKKYKQNSEKMVKSLRLIDQNELNPLNKLNNYMAADPEAKAREHPASNLIKKAR